MLTSVDLVSVSFAVAVAAAAAATSATLFSAFCSTYFICANVLMKFRFIFFCFLFLFNFFFFVLLVVSLYSQRLRFLSLVWTHLSAPLSFSIRNHHNRISLWFFNLPAATAQGGGAGWGGDSCSIHTAELPQSCRFVYRRRNGARCPCPMPGAHSGPRSKSRSAQIHFWQV